MKRPAMEMTMNDLTKSEFSEKERTLINRIAKASDTPENRKSGKSLLRKYLITIY